MKIVKLVTLPTLCALVALNACAAPEPVKPAAAAAASVPPATEKPTAVASTSAPLPVASAAPLRLAPNQPLPTPLTQLTIIDRDAGDPKSAAVANGSPILVQYTGWLYDATQSDGKGVQFDTSRTRVAPFSFIVGVGRVIKGWDQGVIGMRIGGRRTIIIPANLAYGDRGRPNIPANADLIFDIEIINIIQTDEPGKPGTATAITLPALNTPLPTAATAPLRLGTKAPLPATTTELILIDQILGTGKTAEVGAPVSVHYTGWLYDAAQPGGKGKKFDSSVDRGRPFIFPLGGQRVIKGWDQGVVGMKVKGKRTLIIPPQFGYGERGAGGLIPPNATLIFDVELLDVNPAVQ